MTLGMVDNVVYELLEFGVYEHEYKYLDPDALQILDLKIIFGTFFGK
jgi:hypothetical protein